MASQPVTWASVTKTARGLATTAQHTLTVFGLSAVTIAAVLYARPDVAKQVSQFIAPAAVVAPVAAAPAPALATLMESHPAPAPAKEAPAVVSAEEKAMLGNQKQQKFVTSWLSKRYRVAGDAANMLVSTAYMTAHDIKLDPLLILAVMAIESGLNPFAESPVGAQGLMQVMSKVHHDKFQQMGGVQAALNPVANIRVGALILKDYVQRGGSVEAGLKTYVGAAAFETDSGYGSKVLAEYRRLKQVATGKNVPTVTPAAPAQQVAKAEKKADDVVHPAEAIAGL
ncbi:lytic transglycosylase domain-containing protein [Massilia sp. R2A-15]|nr:lytic transglycosylase domain-containing protein [Massilia sp. R2A-15]WLI91742.1 lytic transglycosylase domain-containing protein [Massilia sp. R2A-15]